MILQTIGHASILLRNDKNEPVLLSDPWLLGSCYWRSWWLQNYPTSDEFTELQQVKYCYITHEHPDHYHLPSIRKLGKNPTYISPKLPKENIASYLNSLSYNSASLTPLTWYKLEQDISVLSIPLYNDDSCLLIDTPKAFIVNLNDSKPTQSQLHKLRSYMDVAVDKKIVVLSSYSPASIVNSFRKNSEYVSIKDKKDYIVYINQLVDTLQADYFIPFASQVIFYRPDSAWANQYKVTFDDMNNAWTAKKTQLLHPYARIDLNTLEVSYIAPENYNHNSADIKEKVNNYLESIASVTLDVADEKALEKKLRHHRFILAPLFPRGIGFHIDNDDYYFNTWKGRLTRGNQTSSFALQVPAQAMKDAVTYGHFGDLGITMFTLVILNRSNNPKLIYIFFILLTLHDYEHTVSFKNFYRWLKSSFKNYSWKIPQLVQPQPILS
jgi:hypothetical protein